jgi:hypothetical protein
MCPTEERYRVIEIHAGRGRIVIEDRLHRWQAEAIRRVFMELSDDYLILIELDNYPNLNLLTEN